MSSLDAILKYSVSTLKAHFTHTHIDTCIHAQDWSSQINENSNSLIESTTNCSTSYCVQDQKGNPTTPLGKPVNYLRPAGIPGSPSKKSIKPIRTHPIKVLAMLSTNCTYSIGCSHDPIGWISVHGNHLYCCQTQSTCGQIKIQRTSGS